MKKNYEAWEIKIQDFPLDETMEKQIEYLLGFGILAPSAHNTQPWVCSINQNTLEIKTNLARHLSYGDPTKRELVLGLGCFLENIAIASDYFGYSVKMSEIKDDDSMLLTFEKVTSIKNDRLHLINFINKRHSNRYPYKLDNISNNSLNDLKKSLKSFLSLFFISDNETKNKIGQIAVSAQIHSMSDPKFRLELSRFLKSSFTKESYGMPGFALNIPAIASVFASTLVKKVNVSKLEEKKDLKLWKNQTPVIGILCSPEDSKEYWLKTGQSVQNIWLKATSLGLGMSVWAAAIEHEPQRTAIKEILKTNLYPMAIFRLGFPNKMPHPSPRFKTNEILIPKQAINV